MTATIKQELIQSLIRDSLINLKLVLGLNSLGLDVDKYNLYIEDTIFSLMGFKESEYNDMVYEKIYLPMAEKVKDMDFSLSKENLDSLVLDIYNELLEAKKLENNR